jgi:hypothetical protein
MASATPSTSRSSSRRASRPNCWTRSWPVRPGPPGRRAEAERDLQFDYLGLQTLYDRYFLHIEDQRIEMPQAFFMRVAMGLALNEIDREARAIEFYELLSSFDFMSSTPTRCSTAARCARSCPLLPDHRGRRPGRHLRGHQGKRAAVQVRRRPGQRLDPRARAGQHIKGTNGKSQGVVPFLKVVNDTAVAVNQGGKRKGAVCAYLETWHLDIEEFLELRKNTGDDRRRTHDMNTANWIPDLFMRRVMEGATGRCSRPSTCPDLHDKFGKAFEEAYTAYEAKVDRGEIKPCQAHAGQGPVAQDAVDAVRDRPSLDHLQGRLQRALARSSTWAWCTAPTCAPRSRSTPATPKSRCATWARSTWRST